MQTAKVAAISVGVTSGEYYYIVLLYSAHISNISAACSYHHCFAAGSSHYNQMWLGVLSLP